MLRNTLQLLIIFLFLTGCVSTFQIDGKPIPEHAYTQRNPRTNIKTNLIFTRYIEKAEGKEKFLYPVYLELNKEENIPTKTKSIYIIIEVVNTLKVPYILVKKYTIWDGTPYPCKITQTVSISKQPNRVHQISLPYRKGIKVDFGLRLLDDKGTFIMDIGQAKYKVEGGDAR